MHPLHPYAPPAAIDSIVPIINMIFNLNVTVPKSIEQLANNTPQGFGLRV
jgi:hypothetical protein